MAMIARFEKCSSVNIDLVYIYVLFYVKGRKILSASAKLIVIGKLKVHPTVSK